MIVPTIQIFTSHVMRTFSAESEQTHSIAEPVFEMNSVSASEMINKMKASLLYQAQTTADGIIEQAIQEADRIYAKSVYNAKLRIKKEHALKKKQIAAKKSVQLSIANGSQRMRQLEAYNAAVDTSIERASLKLKEIAASPEYKDLLKKLCLQGLLQFLETRVELAVKAGDAELIKEMIPTLSEEYTAKTSKSVELVLSDYVVPDACIGGVVLMADNRRIQCSNTFLDRLHLSSKDLYPTIRKILIENEKTN